MTITRKNFNILKEAAQKANTMAVNQAIFETEQAAEKASKKTTAYIMERRKKDPLYCR